VLQHLHHRRPVSGVLAQAGGNEAARHLGDGGGVGHVDGDDVARGVNHLRCRRAQCVMGCVRASAHQCCHALAVGAPGSNSGSVLGPWGSKHCSEHLLRVSTDSRAASEHAAPQAQTAGQS